MLVCYAVRIILIECKTWFEISKRLRMTNENANSKKIKIFKMINHSNIITFVGFVFDSLLVWQRCYFQDEFETASSM